MARRPVFFVLLALALVGGAAGASAEDGGPGAIAPGADAISQPCVSIPDSSEFASCFSVTAAIDRAPSVGGTARMGVEVQASAALDAELVIYFPISLEVIDGPGSLQEVRPSPARTGDVAVWVVPLALEGFAPEHLGFTLKAVSDGIAIIEMRLAGENPWDPGDFHVVGFTIGGHGRTASLDVDLSGDAPATVVPAVLVPEPLDRPNEAVPPPAVDPVNDDGTSRSTRAAQSCASGRWSFQAADGTWDPVYNARIEIWDDDTNSGDDRLATGITSSADGSYNLCWTEDEGEGTNQEVYVRVRSFNDIWEVINDDGNYYSTRTTGVVSIAPGSDHDFGHRGTNAQQHRAFSAFDAIDRFWRWGNDPAGSCFDWGESTCRKVVVVWFATSNHGTHFHRVDDSNVAGDQEHQIHLEADIPDTPVIVIHEGGHAAMDDVYNDNRAASDCPADHFAWLESAIRCGWTEGFANWVGISVLDDPFYRWPDGETLPFETPTWGSGEPTTGWGDWEDGAKVEGRVTGAMWDIADTPVAATDYWDRFAEGDTPQWRTFQRWASLGDGNPPRTYAQYWTDRGQDGLNTSDAGARAANYQNTIDIGGEFRDPLPPNGVRLRPSPRNDAHEYSLDPQYGYWSVVAIRPTVDHDLALYDSRNGSGLLSSSTWSGNSFDVIAIDGNHKTDDDFPRVTGSVDGNYDIEWASFNDTIGNGAINLNFVGDIAAVFDSRHNAGER
ncbi:hypothetical protein HQ535_12170, partial [bacterium]|nr:hypothetical protein [bacterium]